MAFSTTVVDVTERRWGWEVRVDVVDDTTGLRYHQTACFRQADRPSADQRAAARQSARDVVQAFLADTPAELRRLMRARARRLRDEADAIDAEVGVD